LCPRGRAMEASVAEHFEGNRCINCMCHSTENLYSYRSTSLLRAADDFYPKEEASQPVYLANAAYNSLFLGEVGQTDWDMFTTTHPDAGMHAAARAVSGSQIYVSDKPGQHNFDLLRQLVLPDGVALLAKHAGRPTRDVLFRDVNADGVSALKIWNRNTYTGVLGVFNAQGARWDRSLRKFVAADEQPSVDAVVRAADIEGLFGPVEAGDAGTRRADATMPTPPEATETVRALQQPPVPPERAEMPPLEEHPAPSEAVALYAYRSKQLRVLGANEPWHLRLARREWELMSVSPIQVEGAVRWAPLGLLDMLNGGGALISSTLTNGFGRPATARAVLRATGEFGAFCSPRPRQVRVNGSRVPYEFDETSGLLTVKLTRETKLVELSVRWRRREVSNEVSSNSPVDAPRS